MDGDLSNEVKQLRAALELVATRLDELEKRIGQQSLTPDIPQAQPEAEVISKAPSAPEPISSALVSPEAQTLAKKQSLEAKIGLYWLNRLGIGLLVLGVVFLILYSFQYFGAFAKIATGYIVGATLLGSGHWLTQREGKGNKWIGNNFMGGGWALTYFTTYALYYFDSVRILNNPIVDLTLLLLVSAAIVAHSLKCQSENLGLLAIILGFITIATSTANAFTAISLILLLGAMSWLIAKTGWSRLYFFGAAAAYAIYLFRLEGSLETTLSQGEAFWAKSAILLVYSLVFNAIGLTLSEEKTSSRKHLVGGVLISNVSFVEFMIENMDVQYHQYNYLFLFISALYFSLWAYISRARNLLTTSRIHMLSALASGTAAVSMKLAGEWMSILWAFEIPVLVSIGLKNNFRSFRWFAFALSLAVLCRFLFVDLDNKTLMEIGPWNIPWTQLVGYFIAITITIAGCYYKMPVFYGYQGKLEHRFIHYIYFAQASAIAWGLPIDANAKTLVAVAWAYQGLASLLLGAWLSSKFLRIIAAILFGFSFFAELGTYNHNKWFVSLGTVAAFYIASYIYKSVRKGAKLHAWYTAAATILLTEFLSAHIEDEFVSLSWAMEGLALLAVGFKLNDKALRVSGLAVFGALLIKLLFFDMAKAEFIYRVLSFIVAGIIILIGNFAYWKFTNKQDETEGS